MTTNIKDAFDNIPRLAKQANPVVDGDYQKDGFWYCGKCNTPKEVNVNWFGTPQNMPCMCKCRQERKAQEEQKFRAEQLEMKIKGMRDTGFPDEENKLCRFENDLKSDQQSSVIAKNYAMNFFELQKKGKGLVFFGSCGTGKTFLASCIANALIDKGIPCLVTSVSRIVNHLSGLYSGKQEYIDSLNNFELLVLEDLGTERDTEYMNEFIYNIIDGRYRSNKALIITTNLTPAQLQKPSEIGRARIYSRVLEMCIPVEVVGADMRRKKMMDDIGEFGTLLGIKKSKEN